MPENSSDNIPRPEFDRPVGHVLGDGLIKLIGAVVATCVIGFGGWMGSIWSSQQELRSTGAELNFKIDLLTTQLAETKSAGDEAETLARDNARRLERIEATRFTEQDAAKALVPLQQRIDQLEKSQLRR